MLYFLEEVWPSYLRGQVSQMINSSSVLAPTSSYSYGRENVSKCSNVQHCKHLSAVSSNCKMNYGWDKIIRGNRVSKDCRFQHFPQCYLSQRASREQGGLRAWIRFRVNKASCQGLPFPHGYISTFPLSQKLGTLLIQCLQCLCVIYDPEDVWQLSAALWGSRPKMQWKNIEGTLFTCR